MCVVHLWQPASYEPQLIIGATIIELVLCCRNDFALSPTRRACRSGGRSMSPRVSQSDSRSVCESVSRAKAAAAGTFCRGQTFCVVDIKKLCGRKWHGVGAAKLSVATSPQGQRRREESEQTNNYSIMTTIINHILCLLLLLWPTLESRRRRRELFILHRK